MTALTRHDVSGHDGVRLAVYEAGPVTAPAVVLIHGWSQCHLSWARQLPLADRLRLVLVDLRGHGASDRPDAPQAYNHSTPWADDLAAVIAARDLHRPVMVGWSMGGWILMDYLRIHGDAALGGAVFVGTTLTPGAAMPDHLMAQRLGDPAVRAKGMFSTDLDENLEATLAFVGACFHQQPEAQDFARMVGFNMLVPPHIRAACRNRSEDYRDTAAQVHIPVMGLWGTRERVAPPELGTRLCAGFPNATPRLYDACGHAPFWEAPDRFNADLHAFVESCQ